MLTEKSHPPYTYFIFNTANFERKEMAMPQPFFRSGDNDDDLQVCCNISEHRLRDNWGFCISIVSAFPSSYFLHSFIFRY